MNYFDIIVRVTTALITFGIGLALAGGPGNANPPPVPNSAQTRADALGAELEARNAFFKLIEADKAAQEETFRAEDAVAVHQGKYAPEGDFEIILGNEGAFKSVESFYLITTRYYPEKGISKPIVPRGAISISGNELEFETLTVDPLRVAFKTKPARGFSYGFEGNVYVRYYKEGYESIVITGTLSKYLNGRQVFHDVVEFEEIHGC